jgi:hypothetical protein
MNNLKGGDSPEIPSTPTSLKSPQTPLCNDPFDSVQYLNTEIEEVRVNSPNSPFDNNNNNQHLNNKNLRNYFFNNSSYNNKKIQLNQNNNGKAQINKNPNLKIKNKLCKSICNNSLTSLNLLNSANVGKLISTLKTSNTPCNNTTNNNLNPVNNYLSINSNYNSNNITENSREIETNKYMQNSIKKTKRSFCNNIFNYY